MMVVANTNAVRVPIRTVPEREPVLDLLWAIARHVRNGDPSSSLWQTTAVGLLALLERADKHEYDRRIVPAPAPGVDE